MQGLIAENKRRNARRAEPYDPLTGEGCYGKRFKFEVYDMRLPVQYLPVEMRDEEVVLKLMAARSARLMLGREGIIAGGEEELLDEFELMFVELRAKYDFEFFARCYLQIKDKLTAAFIPFVLNRGQRRLLATMERMRRAKLPIRVILLKARQWGGSTLVQMYMLWIQCMHRENWNSVICAHQYSGAEKIRDMYTQAIGKMPAMGGKNLQIVGFGGLSTVKYIPERGCRLTVGTAKSPDSVRSDDVKMVHFSEAAYYQDSPNVSARALIASIIGAVPRVEDSLIVIESTANGVGDFFHTEVERAQQGDSVYEFVFVEWFLFDMHKIPFDNGYINYSGRHVEGSVEDFVKSLDDYERGLFEWFEDVTLEGLNWYRFRRGELGSEMFMRQENPSDAIEAFQTSGQHVFRAEDVEALRKNTCVPEAVGYLASETDPATIKANRKDLKGIIRDLRFVHDPDAEEAARGADSKLREKKTCNRIRIWSFPDTSEEISQRYLVVYDPSRGLTDTADNGVIVVFDRYWMMHGGKPEVVAEWAGHEDKDIALWRAVQIAQWYNKALFVPESNTFDSDGTQEEQGEFIFDIVAEVYPNVYSRTEPDKLRQGVPRRYGWHMNRATKPMIVADYVAVLREKAYIERVAEALDEARYYERKPNGSLGAKEGKRDDRLVTRMIGCYIAYRMPLPQDVTGYRARWKSANKLPVGESSI